MSKFCAKISSIIPLPSIKLPRHWPPMWPFEPSRSSPLPYPDPLSHSLSWPREAIGMNHLWNELLCPGVGTPDYPPGIPDMHTIRVDTRITSSITVPNDILTIGHMTKYYIATQGKSIINQRIPSSVDDPRHAYYPTGNWLGDVPSSHWRRRNHRHLPCSLFHSLTKLIARDKAVSTFELYSQTILEKFIGMQFGCCKVKGSSLVYPN
jgi:hypothetical protein